MSIVNDLVTVCRLNYGRHRMDGIQRALRDAAAECDADPTTAKPDQDDCKSLIELGLSGIT